MWCLSWIWRARLILVHEVEFLPRTLGSSDPFAYCLKIFDDSLNIIFIIYRWTILSILGQPVESLHWCCQTVNYIVTWMSICIDKKYLDWVSCFSWSQIKQFFLMQFFALWLPKKHLIFVKRGFFPRALLIISHHDKHMAKSVLLGAHLAINLK